MITNIPHEVLRYITHYLTRQDQRNWAEAAPSTIGKAVDEEDASCADLTKPLQVEVRLFSADSTSQEALKTLFFRIVTVETDNAKYWCPLISELIERAVSRNGSIDVRVEKFFSVVDLFKNPPSSVSAQHLQRFYRCLKSRLLATDEMWMVYQIVQRYLDNLELGKDKMSADFKKALALKAKQYIRATRCDMYLLKGKKLKVLMIEGNLQRWVGSRVGQMPELILEVLWERIAELRASCADMPCSVKMDGEVALQLAERITAAGIFFKYGNSPCAISIYELSVRELAERYPEAVSNF